MSPILNVRPLGMQGSAAKPRRRRLTPSGGFLIVVSVYVLLAGMSAWALRPPESEGIWQNLQTLRIGQQKHLSETELASWRRAIGRHPDWLASLTGDAVTLILTPHRAGLIEGRSALLLRKVAPAPTHLGLSLAGSSPASYRLRGFGAARAWTREGKLLPGRSEVLDLPTAEAGGELLMLNAEGPLRLKLDAEVQP